MTYLSFLGEREGRSNGTSLLKESILSHIKKDRKPYITYNIRKLRIQKVFWAPFIVNNSSFFYFDHHFLLESITCWTFRRPMPHKNCLSETVSCLVSPDFSSYRSLKIKNFSSETWVTFEIRTFYHDLCAFPGL